VHPSDEASSSMTLLEPMPAEIRQLEPAVGAVKTGR